MYFLTEQNNSLDTSKVDQAYHYSVLSFKDYKNPDFFFEEFTQLDGFNAPSVIMSIGDFKLVMPLNWSILCSDQEYIQTIPLYDLKGPQYAFCINPIDGYMPQYLRIRFEDIIPSNDWTSPPVQDKNMLVVPIGYDKRPYGSIERGPLCAIFGPSRIDIQRPISDIW